MYRVQFISLRYGDCVVQPSPLPCLKTLHTSNFIFLCDEMESVHQSLTCISFVMVILRKKLKGLFEMWAQLAILSCSWNMIFTWNNYWKTNYSYWDKNVRWIVFANEVNLLLLCKSSFLLSQTSKIFTKM